MGSFHKILQINVACLWCRLINSQHLLNHEPKASDFKPDKSTWNTAVRLLNIT